MSTNLIDNYITTKNQPAMANTSVAQKTEANIKTKNIKPLHPQGHLVNSSLIDAPVDMFKSVAYDLKSLKSGLSGDSNDHQLGKVNDLGMKLGGLAIAGFLFTQKQTPKTKWMEYIGFGSFFASMALWPKIALQGPARAVHGFNVQQKYEDSMGRKKSFFSDPQYLPWDLYSDKEINKIGDRLGVDRDVPNRREFVQEKMKKIAIQNNTMWMLTAGFATPIMSALISSEVEKHLAKIQDKNKNKKIEAMLPNVEAEAPKFDFSRQDKKLTEVFDKNVGKELTPALFEKLASAMGSYLEPNTQKSLKNDLTNIFLKNQETYIVNDQSIEEILADTTEIMRKMKFTQEEMTTFMPSKEELVKLLKDNEFFGTKLDPQKLKKATKLINDKISDAAEKNGFQKRADTIYSYIGEPIEKGLKLNPLHILNDETKNLIQGLAKTLQNFQREAQVLQNYAYEKIANAPETISANQWNEITYKLTNILGITPAEIEKTRFDRLPVHNLIRDKFETITSDDKMYKKVMKEIGTLVKSLDDAIKPEQIDKYCETLDRVYNKGAAELYFSELKETSDQLTKWKSRITEMGDVSSMYKNFSSLKPQEQAYVKMKLEDYGMNGDELENSIKRFYDAKNSEELQKVLNEVKAFNFDETGSLKRIEKEIVKQRISSVRNCFYRLIDTFDVYRRISTGNFGDSLNVKMKQEVIEEALEYAKRIITGGHAADYSVKFYMPRNPSPELHPGHPKVVNGKVINEYFDIKGRMVDVYKDGEPIPYQKVDLGYDEQFYKNLMKFLFGNDLDSMTKEALGDDLAGKIKGHNETIYKKIGNAPNPFKPGHTTSDMIALQKRAENGDVDALKELRFIKTNSEESFRLIALASDEMFTKIFNQKFNTKKWMKMFGTAAIALTGITLASQFFFGNMRDPKKIKKDGDN